MEYYDDDTNDDDTIEQSEQICAEERLIKIEEEQLNVLRSINRKVNLFYILVIIGLVVGALVAIALLANTCGSNFTCI